MTIDFLPIEGLAILTPRIFTDERGYFMESFNESVLQKNGIIFHAVQDNQAKSSYGILRGLHYQTGEMAQTKLVRVLQGKILDIAVDIRPNSPTYGQYHGEILTAENQKQFYVPKGFAHGYLSLSDNTVVFYKCDQFYSRDHEGGIKYDDPIVNIDWGIDFSECTFSEKDQLLPFLGNHKLI